MAFAALGVALLALGVAIVSLYLAKRLSSAEAVIAQAAIDRRHDETIPRLAITVADRTRVTFVNNGPQDLDGVHFDIVDGTIEAVRVAGEVFGRGNLGALPIGSARTVEAIETEFGAGGIARLRFTCSADKETWIVGGYFEVEASSEAVGENPAEAPAQTASENGSAPQADVKTGVVWPSRGDRLVEYTPQLG